MKKLIYLSAILIIGLTGCNPKLDFSKIVPNHVDKFATEFISEIHNGNIDTCLYMVSPEMKSEDGRQFLLNTNRNIQQYSLDSFNIINAGLTSLLGDNGFTNYQIDYEYIVNDKFLYFNIGIREQNNKLMINSFNGSLKDDSLSKVYAFNLENKSLLHYMFLFFAILIPIFIIITLIFIIRTKLKRKWLWIIGVLFGFVKFILNWTTGQFALQPISFMILGAGYSKSGNIGPWFLSFSIPIVGIIFWIRKSRDKKQSELQINSNESISKENSDEHE